MDTEHQSASAGVLAPKPKNYTPMTYAPKKKVESEEKLAALEQTQL